MIFGLDYTWLSDPIYRAWILRGLANTAWMSLLCILLSIAIGVAGVWLQGSRSAVVRGAVQGYIQLFRNTPPLVQLFFFFFVLAGVLPTVHDPATGGTRPFLGSFGSAVVALGLFAGAFNVEIFRSGVEAVPRETVEACESLGYSRLQRFVYVVLPMAFRVCLPALNNNLVNLVKTTTLASAIAAPELLYYAGQIYADNFATLEVMILIWFAYMGLVGFLATFMHWWERRLRVPGYGG